MIVAVATITTIFNLLNQPILFKSAIEGSVADAKFLCGLTTIAVVALQGFFEHLLTDIIQVEVLGFAFGLDILLGDGVLDS